MTVGDLDNGSGLVHAEGMSAERLPRSVASSVTGRVKVSMLALDEAHVDMVMADDMGNVVVGAFVLQELLDALSTVVAAACGEPDPSPKEN